MICHGARGKLFTCCDLKREDRLDHHHHHHHHHHRHLLFAHCSIFLLTFALLLTCTSPYLFWPSFCTFCNVQNCPWWRRTPDFDKKARAIRNVRNLEWQYLQTSFCVNCRLLRWSSQRSQSQSRGKSLTTFGGENLPPLANESEIPDVHPRGYWRIISHTLVADVA